MRTAHESIAVYEGVLVTSAMNGSTAFGGVIRMVSCRR